MNSLQRSNRLSWFLVGIFTGLLVGCFTFLMLPIRWGDLLPSRGNPGYRKSEGEMMLGSAKGQVRVQLHKTSSPREAFGTASSSLWDREFIGGHYAVIPVASHVSPRRARLYAITDYPGYPTLYVEFDWDSSDGEYVEIGPYGYEKNR